MRCAARPPGAGERKGRRKAERENELVDQFEGAPGADVHTWTDCSPSWIQTHHQSFAYQFPEGGQDQESAPRKSSRLTLFFVMFTCSTKGDETRRTNPFIQARSIIVWVSAREDFVPGGGDAGAVVGFVREQVGLACRLDRGEFG